MSAELLRRAAALIRSGEGWPLDPEEFALAVADWLDAAYEDETRFRAQGAVGFLGENPAFTVARAYLGEQL